MWHQSSVYVQLCDISNVESTDSSIFIIEMALVSSGSLLKHCMYNRFGGGGVQCVMLCL
jgi:hypothetical protein